MLRPPGKNCKPTGEEAGAPFYPSSGDSGGRRADQIWIKVFKGRSYFNRAPKSGGNQDLAGGTLYRYAGEDPEGRLEEQGAVYGVSALDPDDGRPNTLTYLGTGNRAQLFTTSFRLARDYQGNVHAWLPVSGQPRTYSGLWA